MPVGKNARPQESSRSYNQGGNYKTACSTPNMTRKWL